MTKKSQSEIFAWKVEVFLQFSGKIIFFTRIHDPQILNQIDAAGISLGTLM